ncbi:multiple epidermal growth factor-like domains protein 10, partial [Saccostrea cucullata]|uniref:multiple epidermal growth factor-like domains protein 10 n=1 Tax=Saccostrea cuccullata TaxID=36930 RepID=UPI002ED61988
MDSGLVLFCVLGILIGNIATAYENIALNKPAWQQYPYSHHSWGADKAVDGRYSDPSALGGQCTISANRKTTATWCLDLGEVLSIHHIIIYTRTDNLPWDASNGYTARFHGFSVYVSNTTNKDDGILCFKDTKYTRSTIPNNVTIECVKHGRYVIYYNERLPGVSYPEGYSYYAFNELCELEVYGCPSPGLYGENCNIRCPQNCQDGHCNIVDGTCLGCVEGYRGSRCEKKCDNNRYGLECTLTCGNCSNGEQCDHVNGSCPHGCDKGAQGDKCREACPSGRHGKNCVEFCKPNCRGGCNRFNGVSCSHGWYGRECKERCGYCRGNEQCHHVTGSCSGLCEPGYYGDQCVDSVFYQHLANQREIIKLMRRFLALKLRKSELRENGTSTVDLSCVDSQLSILLPENIALNKPAWQLYPYHGHSWGADKAVDGRYSNRTYAGGQCTISENNQFNAIWRVDLGGIFSIHHIIIYYRTDDVAWETGHSSRFLGFSLYISNTTNKDDGILCFKDTNYTRGTIPDTITIECVKHGRYIFYYNERLPGVTYPDGYSEYAYNDLCEVEVYGCTTSGIYGHSCDLPCPQNCQEGRCNIVNGYCLGCITDFKGLQCEERCENDKYGLDCSLYCGNCSNGDLCNHVNGSCPNGCDVGVQGDTCVEDYLTACHFGRHGKNCYAFCNPNCRGGCNRFTGVCESGCHPGWKGAFCENECDGWRYGKDCNISCGSCLSFEQCHHINGTCLHGCDRGFQGEKCNEACPEERYGFDCQDTCSINCGVLGRCNRVTGQCQGGCQAGWKDTKCDKKCDGGTFGLNCNKTCGVCLDKEECHHVNGICLNKCDKGYQGIYCTQVCPNGFYGYNCQETCSADCIVQKACDAMTGQCC